MASTRLAGKNGICLRYDDEVIGEAVIWILSFECLGCGHRNSDTRDLDSWGNADGFWSGEMGEGRVTDKGQYTCDKCGHDEFMQWLTPPGCLRVDEGELLNDRL